MNPAPPPLTDGSIARRINGERIVLAGWSRAILLQMAHPLVAAGVVEHSAFRGGPKVAAHRLISTVRAMLGLTFGDAADRMGVVNHIRSIHTRVHGTLGQATGIFPAGTPYSAEDPALLLWVHGTLLESTVLAYRALVADLTPADVDTYCREAAWAAVALGAIESDVPQTGSALTAYMTTIETSGVLAVGPDARVVAGEVLTGPLAMLAMPAGWLNRSITTAWLPPALRQAYGLPWSDRRERRSQRALRLLRTTRRLMPDLAARFPQGRRG
jgi:uncharacterized protein (DUF2236 family)